MTKIKLFSVFLAVLLLMSTVPSSAFEYAPEENLGTEHSETTSPTEIEAETGSGTEETETEEIETVIFEYSEDVGGNPNARIIPPGMEDLQPPESDSTTEIVTSSILPDGVYAIESVYAPGLWVDVDNTTSAGARVWQEYYSAYPTDSFTRSALFKIKYDYETQSYIIRLMTNNMLTLGFNDSGHLITKTLSSPYDSAIQSSETFTITRVSGAYVIQEYGETTSKALASKTNAGGINNIPDSYLVREYTGTAQDKAKWNFYKYTGVDKHGMLVSYSASLTSIGIPVGSTGTMQNKTWSTVIGSNIPYMQTAAGSSDLMSTSFNSTTGEMSYTALSPGYASIQTMILKDSNSTSQYSLYKYFQVIPQEGMYIVKNVGANKYIDINGTSTTEGALINQLSLSTEDSQKWIIEHVSNGQGYVRIKSAYSNKYIGVDSTDGTSIKQYSAQNNYTLWKLNRTSSGNLKLVCKAFSTSFGLSAPSNTDGTTLSLVSYTNDSDYLDEWVILEFDTAILLAIDDTDGSSRYLYFTSTKNNLQTEKNGKISITSTVRYSSESVAAMINHLKSSNIFIVHTHGEQTGFKISNIGTKYIFMNDIVGEDLSNLSFVLLMTCNTGYNYDPNHIVNNNPVNIVEQMVICGAETVVGFNDITKVSDCNKFGPDITNKLINGGLSVNDAIDSISYSEYKNDMSLIAVVAGNGNKKLR